MARYDPMYGKKYYLKNRYHKNRNWSSRCDTPWSCLMISKMQLLYASDKLLISKSEFIFDLCGPHEVRWAFIMWTQSGANDPQCTNRFVSCFYIYIYDPIASEWSTILSLFKSGPQIRVSTVVTFDFMPQEVTLDNISKWYTWIHEKIENIT